VSDQFSVQRLGLLLRNDFLRGHRTLWIVTATIALLIFVGPLGPLGDRVAAAGFYRSVFLGALFAWGLIMTSFSFSDMYARGTNAAFLMLPATALEKALARLLASTVFLVVFLLSSRAHCRCSRKASSAWGSFGPTNGSRRSTQRCGA
jgi:hypothetical protein